MRTIIYVDGFNLYFRLLVNRPAAKWLNIKTLSERLLDSANVVTGVKYYTARVSGRVDPTAPARQQIYLDALRTVPEISIHLGSFLLSEKFAGLVKPPEFRPRTALAQPWPDVVKSRPFSRTTVILWNRSGSSRRFWANPSVCFRPSQTPRWN
jgi:hypothetical protein